MQNTRTHILEVVQAHQTETVAGLSRDLGLAPATIRRHLDILQRDGFLKYEEFRHGTGRPEHVFSLTETGHEQLPKDYDALLSELVSELATFDEEDTKGRSGEELVEHALGNIAQRAVEPYIKEHGANRIEALRQLLTDRDFAPELEVTANGVRIVLNNCPFRMAAKDNPAICSFDTGLIWGVFETDVEREACIREGDSCCTYVVADMPSAVASQTSLDILGSEAFSADSTANPPRG